MFKNLVLKFVLLLLPFSQIFGGGFQINEQSARAMAMAGAFAGLANDPSAIFFNPAGITQLSGTHFMAGATIILPKGSFRGPSPAISEYDMEKKVFTPINFYATQQITDNLFVGVSVNNQYGLGTYWPKNWVGRYLAVDTEIKTFFFTPVVAYKLGDKLSVSAGLTYATGDITISRYANLSPMDAEAYISLHGTAHAYGVTAGILYKPLKQLAFGLSYRSQAKFKFSGTAKVTAPAILKAQIPHGNISSNLTVPENVTFGVAVMPTDKINLTTDVQYIGWSSYNKLVVNFQNSQYPPLSSVKNYKNTFILRIGGEYKYTDKLSIRLGFLRDFNPVYSMYVEPTLPDANRSGYNIGFGYKITNNFSLNVAYMFLRFDERKITDSRVDYTNGNARFNGVYNSVAGLFAIDFSYNL